MANIFLISDTHFGHANILTFEKSPGVLCRPEFQTVEEMDEYMIAQWNKTVGPKDHVYHLGDFVMHKRMIAYYAERLNGILRLILGNHDDPDMKLYLPFFKKILSSRLIDNLLLTHIPVHESSLGKLRDGRPWYNIHGHVHNNVEQGHFGPRHYNVSVEMIDYTPIPLETVQKLVQRQHVAYCAGR